MKEENDAINGKNGEAADGSGDDEASAANGDGGQDEEGVAMEK